MAIFWRRLRHRNHWLCCLTEAYVTHRQAGKVSVIDAKSYKVVKTFDTPTHPNSLALSADGKTLYVSVKQKSTKQQEATQPDDVIRIAL
jgi:YVTN family beta-propeller protein